jgi:HEAT repeat protein
LLSDLADSENPNALNLIVRSLDARFPQAVREAGISALEDLEDQRALPYLQKLLTDTNPEIRQRASDAIDWLKE